MESPRFHCAICGKQTNAFNYGVNCCNACKMFYKRSLTAPKFPKHCKNGDSCVDCRYCRFQRCLQAGMNPPGPPTPPIVEDPRLPSPDLPLVIQNLSHMDASRQRRFLDFIIPDNLGLDVFILTRSVHYVEKPYDYQPNCYKWAEANINTSIDFVKKFDAVHELSESEMLTFVKSSYLPITLLCTAMWSYMNHRECAEFPGGVDVISDELNYFFRACPAVLNKVRCPIVAKLRDLKISREEFLLISAIIVLNPGSSMLSEDTRALIGKYQSVYSSNLLQYCLNVYQHFGPSRFTDLLGICSVIGQDFEDFKNVLAQFQFAKPDLENKKILHDFMDSTVK